MLTDQNFSGVRLWPRGVDLSQFGPSKRCAAMRASWGVGDVTTSDYQHAISRVRSEEKAARGTEKVEVGAHWDGRQASLPMTPPLTPWAGPTDPAANEHKDASGARTSLDSIPYLSPSTESASYACFSSHLTTEPPALPSTSDRSLHPRVVLLYVGRISWEKNLHLLLAAYARLPAYLTAGHLLPKLVFVGDGPARVELEAMCSKEGYDATFMGHRSGEELARCYASADVFAFPSFTEVCLPPFQHVHMRL